MTEWYYINGPHRIGPLSGAEWEARLEDGTITPETLVWRRGLNGWIPYRQAAEPVPGGSESDATPDAGPGTPANLEEEAPLVEDSTAWPDSRPAEPVVEAPDAFEQRVQAEDYSLPIRGILLEGWRLFTRYPGLLIGATILVHFIKSLAVQFSMALPLVFDGVATAGLYTVFLRLQRGEPGGLGGLLAGLKRGIFRNLVLKTVLANLLIMACFIPLMLAMERWGITGVEQVKAVAVGDPGTLLALLLLGALGALPALFLSFCWMYAVPLIVDRQLSFSQAMRLSRRKVLQHPWRLSILLTIAGGLAAIPALLLLIGATLFAPGDQEILVRAFSASSFALLLAMPFYFSTALRAYDRIFPGPRREEAASENPPGAIP